MTPPKPSRGEKHEKALDSAVKKLERKGVDTSKMPGPAARDASKGNA